MLARSSCTFVSNRLGKISYATALPAGKSASGTPQRTIHGASERVAMQINDLLAGTGDLQPPTPRRVRSALRDGAHPRDGVPGPRSAQVPRDIARASPIAQQTLARIGALGDIEQAVTAGLLHQLLRVVKRGRSFKRRLHQVVPPPCGERIWVIRLFNSGDTESPRLL